MNNIKVLIADDEPDILAVMEKRISREGFFVVTAVDGQQAWQKIQAEQPDIILLDLVMPGMSGFEVLQSVRENPVSDKWQPVIIVSARTDLDDMQKGFALEADHYITKPCNMDDVIKAIRLMLSLIPLRKTPEELAQDSMG